MVRKRGGPAVDLHKSAAGRRAFRLFRMTGNQVRPLIPLAPDASQEIGKELENWESRS
jgi:hypothetical protein